ncbi:MAG: alginate O-acetyltransferase AlgX-related protein [Giesbergeria sp.]
MPTSPGHRRFAAVVALALAVAFLWGAVRLGELRFAPSEWKPSTWVDGHAGRSLNAALGTLPGQTFMDRWSNAFRYRWLGDMGNQVREGCPGWLFYRDGLRVSNGGEQAFLQRVALMRHWAVRFEKAGVRLLVVTVPDKSRIEAGHLCGLHQDAALQARWASWQGELASAAVPFVDVRTSLAALPQAFYRTDVHMLPAGAEAVAERIAQEALPQLGGLGLQQFAQVRAAHTAPRMGDLIVLAGLEHAPDGWRPDIEQIVPERIEVQRMGGLLDEGAPPEVLLVADSNGLRSELSERLGRSLGREVWNLSQDGGYFSGAMLAALARQDTWPRSLKLVVWTFSELSLSLPLSVQEQQALATMQ